MAEISEPLEIRAAGIRAALIANQTLEEAERLRYGELMLAMTPDEVMQRALEVLAEHGVFAEEEDPDPETLSRFFRQGYLFVSGQKEGLAQGRSEGLEQGLSHQLATLRTVLVDILAVRGIMVEDSARARIEQCRDVETLARWCTRASSLPAGSLDELLDEQPAG